MIPARYAPPKRTARRWAWIANPPRLFPVYSSFFLGCLLLSLAADFLTQLPDAQAQALIQNCPTQGIQARPVEFKPDGLILTTFDSANIWVVDAGSGRRYPLPETHPCASNCRLSPDGRWLSFFNPASGGIDKMQLDGTARSLIAAEAADLEWWPGGQFLVWTPGHSAYVRPQDVDEREYLPVGGVTSVQPGGRWGVMMQQSEDEFRRVLIDLGEREAAEAAQNWVTLGPDIPYFNASVWAPDGSWLAYVARGAFDEGAQSYGGEIFLARPGDFLARQLTFLAASYGAVRINGHAVNRLSWSPDATRIAFWVIELLGPNIEANTGHAVIHVVDVVSGAVTVYCGFSTNEHTPNPPRLIWSPDGTHLAFGGNVPGDDKGYLLLALNLENGSFTELSDGIFPALGQADIIAWGPYP